MATLDDEMARRVSGLDKTIAEAKRVGAEASAARAKAAAKMEELAPLVVELALAGWPQGSIATLVKVSRQTIHAIEKSAGVVRRVTATRAEEVES